MSLRAALLALISAGPVTGYDAAKHFQNTVGQLWHAPDSQIYPELRRMHEAGLLDTKPVPWGSGSATKTQYSLTEAGRTELHTWQATPLKYAPERDQAHLISAYFEWAPTINDARNTLIAHITYYSTVLTAVDEATNEIRLRENPTLKRRLEFYDPEKQEQIIAFKLFAYEGKRMHAEAEIRWAQQGIELLAQITAGGADASML